MSYSFITQRLLQALRYVCYGLRFSVRSTQHSVLLLCTRIGLLVRFGRFFFDMWRVDFPLMLDCIEGAQYRRTRFEL